MLHKTLGLVLRVTHTHTPSILHLPISKVLPELRS